jgi:predicted RNase H-like nuclease (RuvC/YqgF family)
MTPDTVPTASYERMLENHVSELETEISLLKIERNSFKDTSEMLNEESIRVSHQLDNVDVDTGLRIAALKSDNKRIREAQNEFVRECVHLRDKVRLWQMIAWAAIGGLVCHALIMLWGAR